MRYLIVDSLTGRKCSFCVITYATERGAKIACTRQNKSFGTTHYAVMSLEQFKQFKG